MQNDRHERGLVTKTAKLFPFTCAMLGTVLNASLSLAQDTGRLLGLATLMLSVVLIGVGKAAAQPQPEPQPKRKVVVGGHGRVIGPPAQQRVAWRRAMAGAARPKKGCFTATYPDKTWHEAKCGTPPNRPYKPRGGIRALRLGNPPHVLPGPWAEGARPGPPPQGPSPPPRLSARVARGPPLAPCPALSGEAAL